MDSPLRSHRFHLLEGRNTVPVTPVFGNKYKTADISHEEVILGEEKRGGEGGYSIQPQTRQK